MSIAYPGFSEASLSKDSLFGASPAAHVRAATAENWILVKFIATRSRSTKSLTTRVISVGSIILVYGLNFLGATKSKTFLYKSCSSSVGIVPVDRTKPDEKKSLLRRAFRNMSIPYYPQIR